MSRMFDDKFDKLFDKFLSETFRDLQGIPSGEPGTSEETFEVTKGKNKTTIIYRFDENGIVTSHGYNTISTTAGGSGKSLKEQLDTAVEMGDFESAIWFRDEIKRLEANK